MSFEEKFNIERLVRASENFQKTLDKAEEFEEFYKTDKDAEFVGEFIRLAVIQAYEIIIELSWKMMQKWVTFNSENGVARMPKRELFRIAHQGGLIDDPVAWWTFFEGRNDTSHIYKEEIAEKVYVLAKKFPPYLEEFIRC